MFIDPRDYDNLEAGNLTESMIDRIKFIPKIIHAGSILNKLRKTNKYKISKRLVFKVGLVRPSSAHHNGHGHSQLIGVIDREGAMMNSLTPDEVAFVNYIYSINDNNSIYFKDIKKKSPTSSESPMKGLIPAAGNVFSGIFTGGHRRRTRKGSKKTSRRRRSTRKH